MGGVEHILKVELAGFAHRVDCGVRGREELRLIPKFLAFSKEGKFN